jgi:hypothetical protein
MEYVILALVGAWIANIMYQGYKDATAKPLPMADIGNGIKEPICPACSSRLVTVTKDGDVGLTQIIGWLFVVGGFVAFLINILAGGLLVLIGAVLVAIGKSKATFLSCPACGKDAKRLS